MYDVFIGATQLELKTGSRVDSRSICWCSFWVWLGHWFVAIRTMILFTEGLCSSWRVRFQSALPRIVFVLFWNLFHRPFVFFRLEIERFAVRGRYLYVCFTCRNMRSSSVNKLVVIRWFCNWIETYVWSNISLQQFLQFLNWISSMLLNTIKY